MPLAVVPALSPVTVAKLALTKYLLTLPQGTWEPVQSAFQDSAQGECFPVLSFSEAGLKWLPLSSLSFPHCKIDIYKLAMPSALVLALTDPEALSASVMLDSMLEDGLPQRPGATILAQGQFYITWVHTAAVP